MKSNTLFGCIIAIYILGFILHAFWLGRTVYGDGIYYFSWVRSLVIDHDSKFSNEYQHFHVSPRVSDLNIPANKYGIGTALLWLPLYAQTHSVVHGDGYSFPYQIATGMTGVLAAITGLALLHNIVYKKFGSSAAVFITAALAFTTNLWFYGSWDTVNSHSTSFLAISVLLYILSNKQFNALISGICIGFIASVRLQDSIFALLVIPHITKRSIFPILCGLVIGFLPQIIAWKGVYGLWIVNTYGLEHEYFHFTTPHIFQVLFWPNIGLFTWSPILLLATWGLMREWWQNHRTFLPILVIILEIYLISSWSTWWQGASYGSRMMVSSLPLFGIGLGFFWKSLSLHQLVRKFLFPILIYPLSVVNFLGMMFYLWLH